MKIPLEIPDALHRRLVAYAASRGLTVSQVAIEAVEEKLDLRRSKFGRLTGWRAVFGIAPGTAEEINRIVEEEFERIEPED